VKKEILVLLCVVAVILATFETAHSQIGWRRNWKTWIEKNGLDSLNVTNHIRADSISSRAAHVDSTIDVNVIVHTTTHTDTITAYTDPQITVKDSIDMTNKKIINLDNPVSSSDAATKYYVDAAVAAATWNFFLTDDSADIGSYYYMYDKETGNTLSELTSGTLSSGNDQLLWSFVTESGYPGIDFLSLGTYAGTFFLKKTGNKTVNVYWKLYKRDTGGNETLILTSGLSDELADTRTQYLLSAYLNADSTISATDRLVLKIYANVSGSGTDPTVTLTMENNYDSRIAVRVGTSAFANIFVNADGDTMTGDLTVPHLWSQYVTVADSTPGNYDGVIYASDDGDLTAHEIRWDDDYGGTGAWTSPDNWALPGMEYAQTDTLEVLSYVDINSGSNLPLDRVTLPAADDSVDVSNSLVTANSFIFITPEGPPVGQLYVTNKADSSFTIKSTADETADLSVIYFIAKP